MSSMARTYENFAALDVGLERDAFYGDIIRELSGLLEDMIGLDEASGFISVVGQNIGTAIDRKFKKALRADQLNVEQIAHTLVELKRRIQGDFYIVALDSDKIVLGNRRCPFGDKVIDRPSLCMMTSNVFGTVCANNTGYAKVTLHETIARGDPGCQVTIYHRESPEASQADGRDYINPDV